VITKQTLTERKDNDDLLTRPVSVQDTTKI